MDKSNKFITYVFTQQFRPVWRAFARRLPGWAYKRGKAYIFELGLESYKAARLRPKFPKGYTCRIVRKEDLTACCEMAGSSLENYQNKLNAGDICYGVFEGSRLANINWIHKGSAYVRGIGYFHLADVRKCYIYGILTNPDDRGKGLYKNCLIQLADFLIATGAEKLIQMVIQGNTPVIHTLQKLGYKKIKEIKHLSLLGIKYTVTNDFKTRKTETKIFFKGPRYLFTI